PRVGGDGEAAGAAEIHRGQRALVPAGDRQFADCQAADHRRRRRERQQPSPEYPHRVPSLSPRAGYYMHAPPHAGRRGFRRAPSSIVHLTLSVMPICTLAGPCRAVYTGPSRSGAPEARTIASAGWRIGVDDLTLGNEGLGFEVLAASLRADLSDTKAFL